jgi:hypothetical protein
MLGISGSDSAVGAVGGDDEVVIGIGFEVGLRLMLEMQPHSELARPLLEDAEEPLAADADEAVAGRAHRLAVDMDLDIVPMSEFVADHRAGDGVVGHQVVDRLVREDDPPAERVAGPVALEQIDVVRRLAQLHRDREVEPGGTSAEACDAHRFLLLPEG